MRISDWSSDVCSSDLVDTVSIPQRMAAMRESHELRLLGEKIIRFDISNDLQFIRKPLAFHPNGMIFRAFDGAGLQLRSREYYSVGGGLDRKSTRLNSSH